MNLRPYRDATDLETIRAILTAGRKAAGPVYYVHCGDLHWWLFYLDPDFEQRLFLAEHGPTGSVIGWVLLSPRFRAFDVFVHPDPTLCEQRQALALWAEEQLRAIALAQGGKDLNTMWVSEHDSQLITHLESRGFTRSDSHMHAMERPLDDDLPEPQLPPEYRLRSVAGEHEVCQRAAVAHAAFESSKPIERYTEGALHFMRSPVYTPELDLVAVAPGGIFAAFCLCWLDPVNQVGHFEPVGTHPDFRRQGLGAAVLNAGLRKMWACGMKTASVCVESDNPAAHSLYEAVGFRAVHRIYTYAKPLPVRSLGQD